MLSPLPLCLLATLVLGPASARGAPAPTSATPPVAAPSASDDPSAASPGPVSPLSAQPAQAPGPPPTQRPSGSATIPATPAPAPTTPTPLVPAPATDPGAPASTSGRTTGSDPAAAIAPKPAAPGLAEQLLGPSVNQHPSTRVNSPVPTEAESAAEEDAAIAAMYRNLFRPASNPGRFNIVARTTLNIAGSIDNTVSGRFGGLSADLGQSFNKFGYAFTLSTQFGSLIHTTSERQTQTVALLGGGPTISLGRLALLQRGFLDLRLGYDFFAGPTRRIVDGVAQSDSMLAPHGPRLALNMGLLSNPGRPRKLFHGFGLTVGYQALVGSLRGDLPITNMLQFGLVYWGG